VGAHRVWISHVRLCGALLLGAGALSSCTKLNDVTAPSCAFALASASASFNHVGGTGAVAVQAPTSCTWSVTATDAWIALTSATSGSGDASIGYTVAANEGPTTRHATLNVSGQSFTVSQTGCSYTVAPIAATFPLTGGSGVVSVTADDGCPWTAATDADWITITSDRNGAGDGIVQYSVGLLLSMNNRSGTLIVAGKTVSIEQVVVQ
jgi:hypothetical protein